MGQRQVTLLCSPTRPIVHHSIAWHKATSTKTAAPNECSVLGPGSFTRSLAARQLAFLIRHLDYQHLTSILSPALPYVFASAKDPSPNVQCYGLQALQHVATGVIDSCIMNKRRSLMHSTAHGSPLLCVRSFVTEAC